MKLYLMRHGEASRPEPGRQPSLTPRGLAEARKVGDHLARKPTEVAAIWHSPLTRAAETARILQGVLGSPGTTLEERPGLVPDGEPQAVLTDLLAFKGPSLLIVSHLPFLPSLACLLLNGALPPFPFPTAGLAAFEGDGPFRLLFTLDPQSL